MQPPSLRAAAGALLLAGFVAGCGAPASPAKSPTVLTKLAAKQLTKADFRFSLSGQFGLDVSKLKGMPANDLPMMTMVGRALRLDVLGEVAAPGQWRLTVSMPPLLAQPITEEMVGGQVYVSHDGVHFQERSAPPSPSTPAGGNSMRGLTSIYSQLGQVRDLGVTRMDGLRLEHLQITVNTERLMQTVERHFAAAARPGSNLAPFARGVLSAVHFTTYRVDEYLNPSSGRPDRLVLHIALVLDLTQLRSVMHSLAGAGASGGATPDVGGTLGVNLTVQMHLFDYGAHIVITKPSQVTPGPATGTSSGIFNFA
ncbi:MAG TPA: hypothetical protein VMW49_07300 [Candidatus Dormibacteraeota bacterium]|nr:hypothetical protein [Candidatus Dormibacteraeota bacterium]